MTTTVPVRVTGELVIKIEDLPEMALEQVKSALTIPNEEREKAQALKQFNWFELPETVPLYRVETRRGGENVICLPRGFAAGLVNGLAGMGIQVAWDDQRTLSASHPDYYKLFLSRDYQAEAALAWMAAQQGFVKGPAGSGKTVLVLWALAMLGQKALIITDKTALANQWRVRAHQFYKMPIELDDEGYEQAALTKKGDPDLREAGFIGQGVWEERNLTICLRQTLHERGFALDGTRWWQNWGAVIFDEGHHLTADTLGDICRKITSVYLGGVSATPWKTPERGMRVTCLVGPIVHEIPRKILYERKVLMKPEIHVINGDFVTPFWPDHDAEYDKHQQRWTCLKPDCTTNKKHGHRNNYSSALKAIVESKERNARIAAKIAGERGHYHLMPSRQLKHLDLIEKALIKAGWPKEKIWKLRGEENAAGLDRVIDQQLRASDEGVLLSTVADEGLDIPPLDRCHMIFPMRDPILTEQIAGRVERVFEGKKDAIVYDWRESDMDVFEGQYDERTRVYLRNGYTIKQFDQEGTQL